MDIAAGMMVIDTLAHFNYHENLEQSRDPVRSTCLRKGVTAVSTKAYVLIETTVGKNRDVIASLKRLKGVSGVDMVTGPFDLIAVVEAGGGTHPYPLSG